jgi:hypothetical protein
VCPGDEDVLSALTSRLSSFRTRWRSDQVGGAAIAAPEVALVVSGRSSAAGWSRWSGSRCRISSRRHLGVGLLSDRAVACRTTTQIADSAATPVTTMPLIDTNVVPTWAPRT